MNRDRILKWWYIIGYVLNALWAIWAIVNHNYLLAALCVATCGLNHHFYNDLKNNEQ